MDHLWQLNQAAGTAFHQAGRAAGVLLWLLACATGTAAAGLVQGRRWAWWFSVVLFAVNAVGDAVALGVTGDLVRSGSGVLMDALFLFALLQGNVRAFFRKNARG
jgi:hypothetical protein